ncbi:MAG: hypothetical protein LC126_10145 [Bryobacterales bacterium]|nr:hypothetical protein [Bryobacterales bacterium]
MKLRIKGNSLRLRLTRPEVARLSAGGPVEESTEFAPDQILRYRIQPGEGADDIRASFGAGVAAVTVGVDRVRQWASSDETGIYASAGALDIAIEKDFRCLTRPEERLDPDVYPHPAGEEGRAIPAR